MLTSLAAAWLISGCGAQSTPPSVVVDEDPGCTDPAGCQNSCDAGNALACNQLGLWLHDGVNGATRDPKAAAAAYRRSCDLRAGIGCYNLSGMLLGGHGIDADPETAEGLLLDTRAHYQDSCDAGGLAWCANLAGLMQRGDGSPISPDAARGLYSRTCDKGHPFACLELANMMADGEGGDRDPEGAVALLRRTCDAGSEESCNNLAIQIEGQGGDPLPIFRQACDRGVAVACRNVAMRLDDPAEALALLRSACEAPVDSDGAACAVAGRMLADTEGQGNAALGYFERACSVGYAESCMDAVQLGVQGQATALTPERGRELVTRACTLGLDEACQLLGAAVPGP